MILATAVLVVPRLLGGGAWRRVDGDNWKWKFETVPNYIIQLFNPWIAYWSESGQKIGGAKLVGHVPVGGVREEELSLRRQSTVNVFPSVDVFLSAVHHTHVS